ncbi:MAG: RNA methyltransferase [Planctomycetota bacterium]|nr:RNA methyltransferase [Planctomycetota bacterium]
MVTFDCMIETRCPNPKCRAIFPVPEDELGHNVPCPACGQVITVRPLSVLIELDRQKARMARSAADRRHLAGDPPLSALLDDIRSMWNVGSMFRTADGAGVGRLYLCGITACPPRKEITKTSLGAEETVPFEYHVSALEAVLPMKSRGISIVSLEATERSVPLMEFRPRPPLCLVVGNEVTGVSREVLDVSDAVICLPMRGAKSSLNAAVAFGIAAYVIAEKIFDSSGGAAPLSGSGEVP